MNPPLKPSRENARCENSETTTANQFGFAADQTVGSISAVGLVF
jgi:hypothetical protein